MLAAPGTMRAIFEVVERTRTSVVLVATSEVSVSVTVDDDLHLDAVVAQLSMYGDVSVERGRGIVALVGAGLGESTTGAQRQGGVGGGDGELAGVLETWSDLPEPVRKAVLEVIRAFLRSLHPAQGPV